MKDKGSMQSFTVGEVAKASGVGVETIRFYEREGLIAEPPRRQSGYRQYPFETVRKVRFIRRAKDLGFTLKEIGELLSLRVESNTTCADVRMMARAKIANIEGKLTEMERMKAALERLARSCRGKGPASECPILDALDAGEEHDADR